MERRGYQRFYVGLECNLYLKNRNDQSDCNEFCGIVEDISQSGCLFRVGKEDGADLIKKISVGDSILFQSADENLDQDDQDIDVFIGEVKVIRLVEQDEWVKIGCSITDIMPNYYDYINRKETSDN